MRYVRGITLFLFVASCASQAIGGPARMTRIAHADVLNLMKSENSFSQNRHPVNGEANRLAMRRFINEKFGNIAGELGGSDKGHFTKEIPYETKIFSGDSGQDERKITGTNIVLILKGSKDIKDDEPIMIVANYDSDNTGNVVDDNGSGIAALLVVGDYFTKQITDERWKLEHSVIFAATDTSIRKYDSITNGQPANASSGSDILVREFLPDYMKDRKKFRGAIVLDSLLNYRNESGTQAGQGIDKAYPQAYAEMAKSNYAGNFLAMVSRDSTLDADLVGKITRGWERALIQPKAGAGTNPSQIESPLISFVKKLNDPDTDAVFHFAKSDQNSFWAHHSHGGAQTKYPAVLLTDTRNFRASICSAPRCNYLDESTKPQNLAFIHRTMMTLYSVLRGQTDNAPGLAATTQSSMLLLTPLVALSLRYVLAVNA